MLFSLIRKICREATLVNSIIKKVQIYFLPVITNIKTSEKKMRKGSLSDRSQSESVENVNRCNVDRSTRRLNSPGEDGESLLTWKYI